MSDAHERGVLVGRDRRRVDVAAVALGREERGLVGLVPGAPVAQVGALLTRDLQHAGHEAPVGGAPLVAEGQPRRVHVRRHAAVAGRGGPRRGPEQHHVADEAPGVGALLLGQRVQLPPEPVVGRARGHVAHAARLLLVPVRRGVGRRLELGPHDVETDEGRVEGGQALAPGRERHRAGRAQQAGVLLVEAEGQPARRRDDQRGHALLGPRAEHEEGPNRDGDQGQDPYEGGESPPAH